MTLPLEQKYTIQKQFRTNIGLTDTWIPSSFIYIFFLTIWPDDHQLSVRRSLQQLDLCYLTTWKILRKDLRLNPFKIQLVQELQPNDLSQRRIFGKWAPGKLDEDPLFYRKIEFSDEAQFWFNGYVNKQNCRFWSEDQSEKLQKLPMLPEKVTVWCGFWAGTSSSKMLRIVT